MKSNANTTILGSVLLAMGGAACSSGAGAIEVETWGEAYIEEGIPAAEFADGWSATFTKFLITLGAVVIADREGDEAARLSEQRVFDLTRPGPHLITRFEEVEAKRWDEVGIEQENASNAVAGHEALSAEDLALMNRDGLSLHVAGRAETGTVSKSFEWSFRGRVAFSACQAEGENLGVLVLAGETATVQFTVHGDHLFYDSLKSDAVLRFATLAAADTDRDGAVSLEELEAVDLTTLPADRYETAGDGSITHLRGLVQAQALTLVHFQGEGHCRAAPR